MIRNFLLFLTFALITVTAFTKDFDYEDYDWEKDRKRETLTAEEEKEPAVILKNVQAEEYVENASGDFYNYSTTHMIIRLNNDAAIEANNTIKISLYNVIEIIDLKVRSISKSGKIKELDKSSIKEVENMENKGAYKVFAVEGLEIGSEIEFLYKLKKYISNFGTDYLQYLYPSKNVHFEVISPDFLVFESRSYNGLPKASDTTIKEKNYHRIDVNSIPGKEEEDYSMYSANLMRVEYKVAYNKRSSKARLLTWGDAAKRIYANTHETGTKSDAQIKKILSKINSSNTSEEDKIKNIESFIKNNYVTNGQVGEQGADIAFILKNKVGTKLGMVRLFNKMLDISKISHKLVLTCERDAKKFDPEFDTWDYLDEYLFYFDNTKKFLAPTYQGYRYPMIPALFTNNHALFIKEVELGEFKTGVNEIHFIEAPEYKLNSDNMDLVLAIDLENEKIKFKMKRDMSGYMAMFLHPYYEFLDDDKKKEIVQDLVKNVSQDAEITSAKLLPYDRNKCAFYEPLKIEADFDISSMLEKAGDKYFFKLGEAIGPQNELYQEKKRTNAVEQTYAKLYSRTIRFKIPEGYKIENLNDINKNIVFEDNGEKTMGFVSTYKVENNEVIIDIQEYYKLINYPVSQFEDFRKVINAAADFNKVNLILVKK